MELSVVLQPAGILHIKLVNARDAFIILSVQLNATTKGALCADDGHVIDPDA
jgi:hypothetical protein